jgi:hypothetical protein
VNISPASAWRELRQCAGLIRHAQQLLPQSPTTSVRCVCMCVLLCTRNARPECESVDAMRSQVFTFQILDDPEDRAQDVAIRLEQKVCAALAPRM